MEPSIPVVYTEKLNLVDEGLSPENIRFGHLTMQSDKFICCKGTDNGKNVLKVLDIRSEGNVKTEQFPMNGDSAIMNPDRKWLAIRGGQSLQVFDAEKRAKVASRRLEEGEGPIVFWAWVTSTIVGLVTKESVYHWTVSGVGSSSWKKVFDVHTSLANTQIISYKISHDEKWTVLTGIAKAESPGVINGHTQLFSVDKNVSQPLQSHAGTFAKVKKEGETLFRNVFCFIEKKENLPAKLYVMEVGKEKNDPSGVIKLPPKIVSYPDAGSGNNLVDFPVGLSFSEEQGILYLITKQGYLFLFDVLSGKQIFAAKITSDTVFATAIESATGGILGVTVKKGILLSVALNSAKLVPYLLEDPEKASLAISLAKRLNLPGAEEVFLHGFNKAFESGTTEGISEAAKIAASAPNGVLRTQETLTKLKHSGGSSAVLLEYFKAVMEHDTLNKLESVELAKLVLGQKKVKTIEKMVKENKILCCEELGDMLLHYRSLIGDGPESEEVLRLALAVYFKTEEKSPDRSAERKVVECFVQLGQFDKILPYAKRVGYEPDYNLILQNILKSNPQAGEKFAKQLATSEAGPLIDTSLAVDMFLQYNLIQEVTSFLIEILKNDLPEEGQLQTKLIEINILNRNFSVVEAIFSNEMFHHFDKKYIANLLEKHEHFKRALELYADISDIKRVLGKFASKLYSSSGPEADSQGARKASEEFVVAFCARLSDANLYQVLETLLEAYRESNQANALKLVVSLCVRYSDKLDPDNVMTFLEKHSNDEAIFFFTSNIVNNTKSRDVVLKFVETGCRLKQFDAVIRVIKDNDLVQHSKERLKNMFLIEKFEDPRPFIHFCDRFHFVSELTGYLVNNDLLRHLEIYVDKVNPKRTSIVINKLIELDCPEGLITKLLAFDSVRKHVDYEALVDILERRNRLVLIKGLLEDKVYKEKNGDEVVHNALAKLYIVTNENSRHFLETDEGYNPITVGAFCEKMDPDLAFICYEKARKGQDQSVLDILLINLCMSNEMYEKLAFYCLGREDKVLWDQILKYASSADSESVEKTAEDAADSTDSVSLRLTQENKLQFMDTVTSSSVLSASSLSPTALTALIKSLLSSDLPIYLITLLEYILLNSNSGSEVKSNSLQNLLLLTAVKVKPERVMGYVKDERLDNFDAEAIAKQCLNAPQKMREEAVAIYKKFGRYKEAVEVMLDSDEAGNSVKVEEIIQEWFSDENAVISEDSKQQVLTVLAKHFLQTEEIDSAVNYYIKAANPEDYIDIIKKAMELGSYEVLVQYLLMCRQKVKEKNVDSSLVYCYCKIGNKLKLEQFLLMPNLAQINLIADRLYKEIQDSGLAYTETDDVPNLFEFCVLLYTSESNHTKLCEIFLKMKKFKQALDAAKKANQIDTWKVVNRECLLNDELELANLAGLNIITNPVYLDDIVSLYEENGCFDELAELLESGTNLEQAHNAIFTQLAFVYAKYSTYLKNSTGTELLNLVKKYHSRMNLARIIRTCEKEKLFDDLCEILLLNNELEQAVNMMIKYPEAVFDHRRLCSIVQMQTEHAYIRNEEVYYRLVGFYLDFNPSQLSDLLYTLHRSHVKSKSPTIDTTKVIKTMRNTDNLPLVVDFLFKIQKESADMKRDETATKGPKNTSLKRYGSDAQRLPIYHYDFAVINEAINELLVEREDFERLRSSIESHPNFDHLSLAKRLKDHHLVEFRKIAAKLFMKKKQFAAAMEICEADNQYEECLYYAKSSKNKEICSDLLHKFSEKNNKDYFIALLVLCSDLIAPDIVLEIGWTKGWTDAIMPFMINYLKSTQQRIDKLETQMGEVEAKKEEEEAAVKKQSSLLANGVSGNYMLTNSAQTF